MNTDYYLKRFVPIPGSAEEMEITVYYSLGGVNYFDYSNVKRGLWLGMTPVRREQGGVTRTLMDKRGRRFLLQELARKNRKKGEQWAAWVEGNLEIIAESAVDRNWAAIAALHAEELQDA